MTSIVQTLCRAAVPALALALAGSAAAQIKLLFNSYEPPGGAIFPGAIKPWIADVEKATEGRV